MTTYFVTRHTATIEWAKQHNLVVDHWLNHIQSIESFKCGDTVLGTLPINMVVKLSEKGVKYGHFSLDVPAHWRGKELNLAELSACLPNLCEYVVLEPNKAHQK